nr:autotransporter domain-containing protein [Chromatocurvus halotolerans]
MQSANAQVSADAESTSVQAQTGGSVNFVVTSSSGFTDSQVCLDGSPCFYSIISNEQSFADVTLEAVPDSGFIFTGWVTDAGAQSGQTLSYSLSSDFPQSSFSATAQFAPDQPPDSDGDGVADNMDQCPNTSSGESVNEVGCSLTQLDSDSDGVNDAIDECPATPSGESVNEVGCSLTQLDSDGDGVNDAIDECPATPSGESVNEVGCSLTQLDSDGDGVNDAIDECPATPSGESVDAQGCGASQLDADGDGVSDAVDQCPDTVEGENVDTEGCSTSLPDSDFDTVPDVFDVCPNTPADETADQNGCSSSQRDRDSDGVSDKLDQCPATPAGESVNRQGCSASQLDDDNDGVSNAIDQCPNTPAGESVDEQGCSESQEAPTGQLDDDNDGVINEEDQCPATPAGESVNSSGCSESQLDDDNDGVSNALDQCPGTPAGESVDAAGCGASQLDSDDDGVNNDVDQCPNTEPGLEVDETGCSEVQNFGSNLSSLSGLSTQQRRLAGRIDEVCPRIIQDEALGASLTPGQRALRAACSRLKNADTSDQQARDALNEILPREVQAFRDYAVELATIQFRQLDSRRRLLNSGGGSGGASVAGLNIRVGDELVPASTLQSAFADLLGMAAGEGEDGFLDFGNLGLFLQGDIDFATRDESVARSGYEFDIWAITAGADYRIRDNLYAGGAVSLGEAKIDYANNGGETDLDNWALSLYGGWQITDNWYSDLMFSYGETDYTTVRRVNYSDANGAYQAENLSTTTGDQLYVGFNTGYEFRRGGLRYGPTASLFYIDGSIDGYSERAGAESDGAWLFDVDRQGYESLRLSLGVQADYAISTGFGVLVPNLRVLHVTEAKDGSEDVGLRLSNNPFGETDLLTDRMLIEGQAVDDQFFDLGVGVSGQFIMGFSGFIDYHFYESFNGFSRDGYSFGLRWDKPF